MLADAVDGRLRTDQGQRWWGVCNFFSIEKTLLIICSILTKKTWGRDPHIEGIHLQNRPPPFIYFHDSLWSAQSPP